MSTAFTAASIRKFPGKGAAGWEHRLHHSDAECADSGSTVQNIIGKIRPPARLGAELLVAIALAAVAVMPQFRVADLTKFHKLSYPFVMLLHTFSYPYCASDLTCLLPDNCELISPSFDYEITP
ncbi:hypothetical protein [Pararhizobium sp. DWP1-1-3]|uniref:hypothetical protein n=1 Tax=Pararhizobium sp. DWP1-1-3 TaxID=2804652 RepID=UPI003CE90F77